MSENPSYVESYAVLGSLCRRGSSYGATVNRVLDEVDKDGRGDTQRASVEALQSVTGIEKGEEGRTLIRVRLESAVAPRTSDRQSTIREKICQPTA